MSRIDFHDKVQRTMRLLLGMRHMDVRRELAPHQLTDDVLRRGWALVNDVGLARVEIEGPPRPAPPATPKFLLELDRFQKFWFPLTRAVLKANYPEIGEALFSVVGQQRGAAILFNVLTFLGCLEDLAQGHPRLGPNGPAARAALAERGLTDAVVKEAERTLSLWGAPNGELPPPSGASAEEAAVARLWAFYLEWSKVALLVLTNPAHLRWLGLRPSSTKKRGTDSSESDPANARLTSSRQSSASGRSKKLKRQIRARALS